MLPLNQYTAAQRAIYNRTIRGAFGSYDMKVTVQVLTNQHAVVSTVSHVLMDGQVDVDATDRSRPSRSCLLQFLDPGHSLAFDSSSPTDGALYLDRLVRVVVSVRCSFGWVDVPVFTGGVDDVERDGDIVNVTAKGMEMFALRSAWEPHTYKKGYKVDVIRSLLLRTGEVSKYMEIPSSKSRIAKPVVVGRESQLWTKIRGVVASMDRHPFYDGRGIFRTTRYTTKPVVTFDGKLLLSQPRVSFSTSTLKNAWIIKGGDPAGPKKVVSALVVAPRSHPLSPWTIGRDKTTGRGGFLTGREDNPHLRTFTKAIARGKLLLDQSLVMGTEATGDCMPVWHLEEFDHAHVATSAGLSATVSIRKFSLPLRADATMAWGYNKDLRKPRRLMRTAA